ncbi:MAG: UDP-glucuronosyltransferase [Azoarcus sp.]|nr:UDP-glucuronosyltransferase [Azoarcus sp.]
MARVLIAWEMGANLGHLARCRAVAQALAAAGIDSVIAARELGAMDTRANHIRMLPAPRIPPVRGTRRPPPANYAELLLAQGYTAPDGVAASVRAWLDMIELCEADYVLADYAPTAMLAAHLAGLPYAAIGNGFAVPPCVEPWPSIRVFDEIPPERLVSAESTLDRSVARALGTLGHRDGPRIRDLFGPQDLLDTFAELDHYGIRPQANYIGPVFGTTDPLRVPWLDMPGPRVGAYIRASVPGARAMLDALKGTDLQAVCVMPDLPASVARRYATQRLRIALRPVALDALLPAMDLMIGYGGGATMSEALLAGVPLLLMPDQVEHYLAALCVERLGAGKLIGRERGVEHIRALIPDALSDNTLRENAQRFALRYQGYRSAHAIDRVVTQIAHTLTAPQPTQPIHAD